jgi:outer membrane protein assembly factor BamB
MRKVSLLFPFLTIGLLIAAVAPHWISSGGDPQRSRWQQRDRYIRPARLKEFKLLWKLKLDNQSIGLNSLTEPTIIGPVITHRGMKELVVVSGASDNVYAVDADLGRLFWKRHLETTVAPDKTSKWPCGAGLTAAVANTPLTPPARFPAETEMDEPTQMKPLYALASDGSLHTLRASTGLDIAPPVTFLPPNAKASSLNMAGQSIYTTTSDSCGGTPNGVWAIDVSAPDAKPRFAQGGNVPASADVSVGFDGTVYSAFADTISSLDPGTLKVKEFFKPPSADQISGTPVLFSWKGRELIAIAGTRGQITLLDTRRLGGETPQYTSGPLVKESAGKDGLSTWEDADGTRWIYAVVGGLTENPEIFPLRNGDTPHGSIVAFKVTERNNQTRLAPAWISRDLVAPALPVIVNGMIFALSSGAKSTPAILYALDATTGKELYSSGKLVTSFTHSSGLAVANGHVCFGTWDNTLYCFGIPTDI